MLLCELTRSAIRFAAAGVMMSGSRRLDIGLRFVGGNGGGCRDSWELTAVDIFDDRISGYEQ